MDEADEVVDVARRGVTAYAAGDYATLGTLLSDDIVYVLYLDQADYPFAGETQGRDVLMERFRLIHGLFEYVLFRPFTFRARKDTAHTQVEFIYRHRATGEVLDGRFRLVLTVRDGLVCRIEEYHDAARVEAFARLIGGVAPEGGDGAGA